MSDENMYKIRLIIYPFISSQICSGLTKFASPLCLLTIDERHKVNARRRGNGGIVLDLVYGEMEKGSQSLVRVCGADMKRENIEYGWGLAHSL